MNRSVLLPTLVALGLAGAAGAQGLDASQPLRCALAQAAECDEQAACSEVGFEQIELPDAWRIDFASKQLVSLDGQRRSPISVIELLDGVLVLQGHQSARGWTLVVERASGHVSGTIASAEGAFVLAGGCSAE